MIKGQQIRTVVAWHISVLMLLVVILVTGMIKAVYDWGYDDAFYSILAQEGEKVLLLEEESPEQLEQSVMPTGMMPELFTTGVYRRFTDLPENIQDAFSFDSSSFDSLFFDSSSSYGASYELLVQEVEQEVIYLLPYGWSEKPEFYLLHRYSLADEEDIGFFSLMLENRNILLVMIMLLVAYALMMHLGLRLVQPVWELRQWVQRLDQSSDGTAGVERPSFKFVELEQVAHQVQLSFQAVQQQAEKEKQFLRTLSHELRTPLAISKAALELLSRQKTRLPEKVQSRLDKLQRANSSMIATSDAILWLWSQDPLPEQEQAIQLQPLLQDIVKENQHLLRGRKVDIVLPENDLACNGNTKVLTILLRNLIRNAFQYSAEGEIRMSLRDNQLCIDNPLRVDLMAERQVNSKGDSRKSDQASVQQGMEEGVQEYGFGIGLYLVQHTCQRLGWQCRHQRDHQRFSVQLSLPSMPA
mgnify:CR=1 FL=1